MRSCVTISVLLILLSSALGYAQVAEMWEARYSGIANAMALDSAGNIYVTGGSNHYATLKYNPDGIVQWVAIYTGQGYISDEATYIALDDAGNVYVTGNSTGYNTWHDIATVKYNSEGRQVWVARYNGPLSGEDMACGLKVDNAGNVYVAGRSEGQGTDVDFAVIKYNANGVQQWAARYDHLNGDDYPYDFEMDGSGNVYILGYSVTGGENYVTIKYAPDGHQQWIAQYAGPGGQDIPRAMAVDQAGNVFVTGGSSSGNSYDCVTIKYDTDGNQMWQSSYNSGGISAEPEDLTMDADGNIYVTGMEHVGGFFPHYFTIKLNGAGALQWSANYFGPAGGADFGRRVAVDDAGNVYVSGWANGGYCSDWSPGDYGTVKYNSAGIQQWSVVYSGHPEGDDFVYGIAANANGDVYITGASANSSALDYDYCTIKYSQTEASPIDISLTPSQTPIVIPANGGSFQFTLETVNHGTVQCPYVLWTGIKFPADTIHAALGPVQVNLPLNQTLSRLRTQNIPGSYPPGDYLYIGYAQQYLPYGLKHDSSYFSFTKTTASDGGPWVWDSNCYGDPFQGEAESPITHNSSLITSCSPNPFNPTTAISYQLSTLSQFSLRVYDTTGRLVATLVDGMQEAGSHNVIFDGSKLSSGLYFVKLQTGDHTSVQKLVLMK